jgi:hypothetical protein
VVVGGASWRPGGARAEAGQRGARGREPEEGSSGGGWLGDDAWMLPE